MGDTNNLGKLIALDKPGVRYKASRFDQDAKWVWTPGLMTHYERSVYQFLNIRGGNDRKIFSSQQDISEHVGFSDTTVKRAIAGLKAKGLISYTKIKTSINQKYPSNSYTLYVPEQFSGDLHQDYLDKLFEGKPEKGAKKSPESRSDLIDTSKLRVDGYPSFQAFLGAYEAVVPEDSRYDFPKTWREAREKEGAETLEDLRWAVEYMVSQIQA